MYVHSLCMSIIILCARFHLNSSKIMKKKRKRRKRVSISFDENLGITLVRCQQCQPWSISCKRD